MKSRKLVLLLGLLLLSAFLVVGCGEEEQVAPPEQEPQQSEEAPVEITELSYVGSDSCQGCHSSEFDGWKATAHPYMIQTADNMWDITREFMEAELAKGQTDFTEIGGGAGNHISSLDEVVYISGHEWKQRLVVKTDDGYRFVRVQINPEWTAPDGTVTEARLSSYGGGAVYEDRCIACHSTGFDIDKLATLDRTADDYRFEDFVAELGVGCEACHGPGSAHIETMSADDVVVFGNYTPAEVNDFCGGCHARNAGTVGYDGRQDPIGMEIGMDLRDVTKPLSLYAGENVYVNIEDGETEGYYDPGGSKRFYGDGTSRSHRMHYNELEMNTMKVNMGYSCITCHDLHDESTLVGGSWDGLLNADLGNLSCGNCHDIDGWDINEAMPFTAGSAAGVKDIREHSFGPRTISDDIPEKE